MGVRAPPVVPAPSFHLFPITTRKWETPDGQKSLGKSEIPSGIPQQESIVRKSEVLLSVGRQESFCVGSS